MVATSQCLMLQHIESVEKQMRVAMIIHTDTGISPNFNIESFKTVLGQPDVTDSKILARLYSFWGLGFPVLEI